MPQIDLCGDDALSVAIDNSGQRHSIAEYLRDTGTWLECIEGMQSVVIRFDSASLSIDGAKQQLCEALDSVSKDVAESEGVVLTHAKPHGALYSDAAGDRALAELFVEAVKQETNAICLVGPPDSELQQAARRGDLRFVGEAFVDRVYSSDGRLVPRSEPGAVHSDINTISTQAVRLATAGQVTAQNGDVIKIAADTLCIHGDTENAYQVALAVRDVLEANGVEIRAAY